MVAAIPISSLVRNGTAAANDVNGDPAAAAFVAQFPMCLLRYTDRWGMGKEKGEGTVLIANNYLDRIWVKWSQ